MADATTKAHAWHLATAMALSAFSWMLLMFGHELIGHGGACAALGGDPVYFDAMYFECGEQFGVWQDRIYRSAGSIFNVLEAVVCLFLLRRLKQPRSWTGYFLWITAILSFFQAGAYVAFGRFIHPGMDWAMILEGTSPYALWSSLVTTVGVGLLIAGIVVERQFEPLFLSSQGSVLRQKLRLLVTPVLTATIVSVAAAALVPSDDRMLMLLGGVGNSLFFLSPILWLLLWPTGKARIPEQGPSLGARPPVIAAALVTTLVYVLVVSRGIQLS